MAFVETESTLDEKASEHRLYFNKNGEAYLLLLFSFNII
jgi:hypothetical protein